MKTSKKILLTATLSLGLAACERISQNTPTGDIVEYTQDSIASVFNDTTADKTQAQQQQEVKATIDSIEQQEEKNIYTITKTGVILDNITQEVFPLPAGVHIPYKYIDQSTSTPERITIHIGNFTGSIDSSSLAPYNAASANAEHITEKYISVNIDDREMKIYDSFGVALKKSFPIALGSNGDPLKDKIVAFDGNIPKGKYYICALNPQSKYGVNPQNGKPLGSLMISYPNMQDAREGLLAGAINRKQYDKILSAIKNKQQPPQNTPLGNHIMIHGGGSSQDRTAGCIALSDEDMLWLYKFVPKGTDVIIE